MSLPPTATASLVEEVDKCLICVLRDGRKLIGYLRTVDQFANLVFQDAVERIYVDDYYGDIQQGIVIVRGENVVLLGELDAESAQNSKLTRVSAADILQRKQVQLEERKKSEQEERQRRLTMQREQPDIVDDF
ncbi:hypothetical protein PTSG_02467 [Salpingoeca rosetta]|uniref:U6 snRNA-associated Sm-like protein LSm1 n=1 Tax=Salpingoeca rosetta (strain ATCC 50818 / BSB-021) TaxID=946362 RepID=F2U2A3_SALR5|nr:uncharacterized protein PTSG_02467 [Salpingoeca rosetta]EGD81755.1 hypothetical protein PTSG_02467 [Salpingoeca rosetta]|eukprot:XP_004996959.1 hypothetical protein PTSG_02467 [Salpingoeca rosetta]